jgi:hypothetical protein
MVFVILSEFVFNFGNTFFSAIENWWFGLI